MGGPGSGRWGGRPSLEATGAICITVSEVLQRGKKRHYRKRSKDDAPIMKSTGALDCWRNQERDWLTINFEAVTNATERVGFVDFSHVVDGRVSEYRIHLQGQQQPFGGLRWFFECPGTGERVHTLCLPRGISRMGSRQAFRLGYQCQRESDSDRAYRRAWKARRKLGGLGVGYTMEQTLNTPVSKPRYRHWEKFDRDLASLESKTDVCDLYLYSRAARLGLQVPSIAMLRTMAKPGLPPRLRKAVKRQNAKRQIDREMQARVDHADQWAREHYGPAGPFGYYGG